MAWQPLEKGENNFDIVIIGAGISGINFGYRIQERCPHLSYTILEGRHEMGGTWSLFKYPGIRSDSDLHTFGFPWRPWAERNSIAAGDLIKNYLVESAQSAGIDKHIQYNVMVNDAGYDSSKKQWTLETMANKTEKKTFKCRYMLFCTGYYDYSTPLEADIPGIKSFQGEVIHPQFWPEDLDYTDKDVVVIGSGATAVTVLPVMGEKARSVTMLQRSPGYVMAIPTEDGFEKFFRYCFSWAPGFRSFMVRLKWILAPLLLTTLSAKYPKKMRQFMYKATEKQLPKSVPRDPHFTPTYYPWEQRMCMCPDGDFFKALRSGKSRIETGTIKTITEKSIVLNSGKELHPDIIVTATGLKLNFAGNINVSVDGKPYKPNEHFVWKGVMLENLPNAAFVVGYVNASWTLGADATAQLVTRMFNQMKKEGVVEVTPHQSEDDLKNLKETNILKLNSTYVTRGKHMLPKAGDRGQWVPRSNYIKDIMYAWYGDIKTNTEWVRA